LTPDVAEVFENRKKACPLYPPDEMYAGGIAGCALPSQKLITGELDTRTTYVCPPQGLFMEGHEVFII
jgi:hypothetical protein